MANGNPIWPARETAESLRERLPTSVAFLRETATAMLRFCELSRERFTEAADEIERLQAFIATMPGGLGQYADWKSKQLEAAQAAGGK